MDGQQGYAGRHLQWSRATGCRIRRIGLNPYQHIHNAAILSALNPPPAHFAFLDALGFNSGEVKRAGYWQAVYQAIMRHLAAQSRRHEPQDGDRHGSRHGGMAGGHVSWLHRGAARWHGRHAGQGQAGPPRSIHDCDADRKRAHRDQFKSELRMALDLVAGGDRGARHFSPAIAELRQQMSEFGFGKDTTLTTMGRADLDAIGGTVYASIYHAEPLDFFPLDDIEAFIDGLRFFHQFAYESKEMNGLISPGHLRSIPVGRDQPRSGEHPRDLGHLVGQ